MVVSILLNVLDNVMVVLTGGVVCKWIGNKLYSNEYKMDLW